MVRVAIVVGGLALVCGAYALLDHYVGPLADAMHAKDSAEFRKIDVGMADSEVRGILGDPGRDYSKDAAPEEYYVSGYAYEKRSITGKVWIYTHGEAIAYFYFDLDGKVEHVYIGGS